jgi:hypothetical protein
MDGQERIKNQNLFAELSDLAKRFNVIIVTATQPHRPNDGYVTQRLPPLGATDVFIVDYLDILS